MWAGGWTAGRTVPLEVWGPSGTREDMGTKYAVKRLLDAYNWDYMTRAVTINRGRVVVQGPVSQLRPQRDAVKILTDDQERAAETLRLHLGADIVRWDEGYLVVQAAEGVVPEVVHWLVAGGVAVRAVVPASEQGLEDYFLELTEADGGRLQPKKRCAGIARLLPGGRR